MIYQLRFLCGMRYSGICHCKNFELVCVIYWFDKQIYILYSNYTIKNKNNGEAEGSRERGGCGRAKRGQEAADPRSGCGCNEQKRQGIVYNLKYWRGG